MKHISLHKFYFTCLIIISLFVNWTCSVTKHLNNDEYLVNKYQIKISDRNSVRKDQLESLINQKPNKKLFRLFKVRLAIYNAFSDSKKKVGMWLTENFGEPPVIYDEYYSKKTIENIKTYLLNKGYYSADARYSTKIKKKKTSTKYMVYVGTPYRFRGIRYDVNDTTIQNIIFDSKNETLIRPGELFDLDALKAERERLSNLIKNKGYYNFNKEHITFKADTAHNMHVADITVGITDYFVRNNKGIITQTIPHKKYIVDTTFITYNFDPKKALKYKDAYYNYFDTLQVSDKIFVLYQDTLNISPRVILQSYYIENNDFYKLDDVNKTKKQLSLNKLFKLVNITFSEQETFDSLPIGKINCNIQITPFTLQSFTVELEGTNTDGDWGAEVNLKYKHKNLFKGAEIFTMKLKAAFETQEILNSDTLFYSQEYGLDLELELPKFLFPFKSEKYDKNYKPKTIFNSGFSYEKTVYYTKPALYLNFGYLWLPTATTFHKVNLIDLSGIRYFDESSKFEDFKSKKDYYKYSYEDYYIYAMNYTFNYNNQNIKKGKDFQYLKLYFESSGNLMNLISEATNMEKDSGAYTTFNVPYSQYIKTDLDFRYYRNKNKKNPTVFHFFFGIGYAYSNSEVLPSIKSYYSGGANSMRAWSSKSLGPGSYKDPNEGAYHYYLGDLKLELNIEKRFHIFWLIDGAVFLDIGNIWTIHNVGLDGAQFKYNKFYKDLAIGTGAGLRFDFNFLILRTDLGLKIKDPTYINSKNSHWIIGNRNFKASDYNLNIAIGYPF